MSGITVIGGTGYAGSSIVKEAAARGHEVTALSRKAPAEPVEGVRYVQGSADTAGELVSGADVIVGALSPRAGSEGTLVETYTKLAERAAASGARLIVIGGFGSLRPAPGAPRFAEGDAMPPEFLPEAREMASVLGMLERDAPASLDWVFISPAASFGAFAPGERRGVYRSSVGGIAVFDREGPSAIGGEDFAIAVVDEIEQGAHRRAHLHFAY